MGTQAGNRRKRAGMRGNGQAGGNGVAERRGRRRAATRVARAVMLAVGIAALAAAGVWLALEWAPEAGWQSIRDEYVMDGGSGSDNGSDGATGGSEANGDGSAGQQSNGIDWDALLARNGDVRAWLRVGNTPIDYPVVQGGTNGQDGSWYLRHDLDGNWTVPGTLLIDEDSSVDSGSVMIYGHHLGDTGKMFASLYDMYKQERFDTVGDAELLLPDGSTRTYEPVMCMSVDKEWEPAQRYVFDSTEDMRAWLADEMLPEATATASDAEGKIGEAEQTLVLVTCTSNTSGQRWRTLLVMTCSDLA